MTVSVKHSTLDASKPTRNGIVHPMIHLLGLLLASSTLTCADIEAKVRKVRNHEDLSPEAKAEIIVLYREHMTEALGIDCLWDAKAD